MYRYEHIKNVHLEVTSKCNAACPMCSRNISGGIDNPNLPMAELSIGDVKKIFPVDFIKQLNKIWCCGNYGDPIVCKDLIEIVSYFRENNPKLTIGINSNGGAGAKGTWAKLASIIDHCQFGIDGLEETNHIYRRKVMWHRLMSNVDSFIQAGGNASWEFIVFRHNEHQIEEARKVSCQMGFKHFKVRKTHRFFFGGRMHNKFEVKNNSGDTDYYIEPPINSIFLNEGALMQERLSNEKDGFEEHLNTTYIDCKALKDSEIYISAEGFLYPCCYLGTIYKWYENPNQNQVWKLIKNNGGFSEINTKLFSIEDILSKKIFQECIPNGWKQTSIANGRLSICANICGECLPAEKQHHSEMATKVV